MNNKHAKFVNMEDDNLIQNALEQLQVHTGIEAELKKVRDPGIDGKIHFNINGKTHVMYIEVKRQLRAHQVMNLVKLKKQYDPLLVIAENIYPKLKEELRRENIAYLETNGNVYLKDNIIFRLILLLWQTRRTVESIKLIPVHSPRQQ